MNDPLIARFADACGATAPLDLRVDLAGGGLLAEGSVDQPFTLVGRDDSCDVTLSDPDINPRHAWLQVLGGRVFAIDLGSRTGLLWPGGTRGSDWLDAGVPAKVGPFLLRLRAPAAERPSTFPPNYNPLVADTGAKARPAVSLEFRNGKRAKDRWAVNRLVTLVGRSPECKIHLTADDISLYHCGLVSTRDGLWVVDLSGRGVVVNGERMRVAPLTNGAELWVGRFLIGCQYQAPPGEGHGSGAAPGDHGVMNSSSTSKNPQVFPPTSPPAPKPPQGAEDEVELGATPESADDLPNSHIMADAFRQPAGANVSGPASNSITVSGSGPTPGALAPPPPHDAPLAGLFGALGLEPPDDGPLAPVLRQMADLHARTFGEFEQWLRLVARLFGQVKREHVPVVQHELNRIETLTAEITALQLEVSRHELERVAADRAKQPAPSLDGAVPAPTAPDDGAQRPELWVPPSARTPIPDPPRPRAPDPAPAPPPNLDRLRALQQERANRWQTVIALFARG